MAENKLNPCLCGNDVELCRGDDDYYIYCPKCKLKTFQIRSMITLQITVID